MLHHEFFRSKHPIVCLPMNGVSDLNLALAISRAGSVPSLSFQNYKRYKGSTLSKDVSEFKDITGTNEIMISVTDLALIDQFELIYNLGVSHIEIIVLTNLDTRYDGRFNCEKTYIRMIEALQKNNTKVLIKSVSFPFEESIRFKISEHFVNGIVIKGVDGAGIVGGHQMSLSGRVKKANKKYEEKKAVIACGGIATSEDVNSLLSAGATSVGIGSLFALSEESKVAKESKLKIIQDNKRQLDKLMCENTHQNAFVISKFDRKDDTNHTNSLHLGVMGLGGHLFMGAGIKEVNEILPVKEIVARLTVTGDS